MTIKINKGFISFSPESMINPVTQKLYKIGEMYKGYKIDDIVDGHTIVVKMPDDPNIDKRSTQPGSDIQIIKPSIIICSSCQIPFPNYMLYCPKCLTLNSENHKGAIVSISKTIPRFDLIESKDDANSLARYFMEETMPSRYSFGQFVSHYAVFIHNINFFMYDLTKCTIHNTRTTAAAKLIFITDFMEYVYGDGTLFTDMFDLSPNELTQIELPEKEIEGKLTIQQDHKYYFSEINIDNPALVPFLGRMILFHKLFEPIAKEWVENINPKQVKDKKKFRWLNTEMGSFLKAFNEMKDG